VYLLVVFESRTVESAAARVFGLSRVAGLDAKSWV
jgi:hypothetical protein